MSFPLEAAYDESNDKKHRKLNKSNKMLPRKVLKILTHIRGKHKPTCEK